MGGKFNIMTADPCAALAAPTGCVISWDTTAIPGGF